MPAAAPTLASPRTLAWLLDTWPLLAVLLGFAAAAVIVPALTQVSTTDDWAYSRSAQILVQERRSRTLQRLITTAMKPWQIVAGHMLAMFTVVFLQTVMLVLFGQKWAYAWPVLGLLAISKAVLTPCSTFIPYLKGVGRGPL